MRAAVILLSLGVASCGQENRTEPPPVKVEAAGQSRATLLNENSPTPPEPAGGCKFQEFAGGCISNPTERGGVHCVMDRSECRAGESFEENVGVCRGRGIGCPPAEGRRVGGEGVVRVLTFQYSKKGGDFDDVSSDNPVCDPRKGGAFCTWQCIAPRRGREFDITSVSFTAKEQSDCHAWDALDPLAPDWKNCANGENCEIGWSRWEAIEVTPARACGRFKNWSHDRERCAKIQIREK
jgi:hypothetical protein